MLYIGQPVYGMFSNEKYIVQKELGQGGQGIVYLVHNAQLGFKAMKWYFKRQATQNQKKSICDLVRSGAPDKSENSAFVWPIDVVYDEDKSCFGYIMELIDFSKYITMGKMMASPSYAPTMQKRCEISIKLVEAFAKLHAKGYCYRDINEQNFVFNPKSGDICICDNDNVSIDSSDAKTQVLGQIDFMAPEIIKGDAKPSKATDYHSLAILLFKFWVWHHPFDGLKEYNIRCWDRDAKASVYGLNPVYVFHKTDKSNTIPDDINYHYVDVMWEHTPNAVKELFYEAFVDGVTTPKKRVIEQKWIKVFSKLIDSICYCPNDGAENFCNPDEENVVCWHCGEKFRKPASLQIINQQNNMKISSLIVNDNRKVFQRHVEQNLSFTSSFKTIGVFVSHPKDKTLLGLRNLSDNEWIFTNRKGEKVLISKDKTVPVWKGNKIEFAKNIVGVFSD